MIVCLAASQALAAYDFSQTKSQMLNDMKSWDAAAWKTNINALLATDDPNLIKKCINVAKQAIGESKVPGVNANLLAEILGDNDALIGERLAYGGADGSDADGALKLRTPDPSRTVGGYIERNPDLPQEKLDKYNVEGEYTKPEPKPEPEPISKDASK